MRLGKIFLYTFLLVTSGMLQTVNAQWGAPYTNNWIVYGKPYVKIGVTQKGIHKLPFSLLPANFPVGDAGKLQLWHRGEEVAIISTENKEIVFYAVPNDGASDSLLYRPMSSRINPYYSLYSDESAYFLTVGDKAGIRAEQITSNVDTNVPVTTFHTGTNLNLYKDEYSLGTIPFYRPAFFNSYFEIGASKTGKSSMEGKATDYTLQLTNYYKESGIKPRLKLLLHGRTPGNKNIEIRVGKTAQSLRLVRALNNNGFSGSEFSFDLEPEDLTADNKIILNLKAVGSNSADGYSLTYYLLSYPQLTDMKDKKSFEFSLAKSAQPINRLNIANAPVGATILDISNVNKPKVINGQPGNLMVPHSSARTLNLLVTSEAKTIEKAKVTEVKFSAKYPTNPNYIILTSENLLDGANKYAAYRASTAGGGFVPIVVNIKDVYNQFNYGEPSPVAIRRFVDYMVSSGTSGKYLHLIGRSITFNERMIRELPDEVPSVGYPGSDILLVEGLGGVPKDVPAVSIGRLSAVTNQNVLDYLQKVKDYEQGATRDFGWKKDVLHLNGGKTVGEITQLKNLLAALEPKVVNGVVGGKVIPFVKQQAIGEVEYVNITPEVNNGVGLITYFGHGSTTVTDLNMGYITDANRGYNNKGMYPMMYFNGCGVGNIFAGRFNPNPAATDRYTLSMDWLLAPNGGAIAVIANSFESFVGPSSKYLSQLYTSMFTDSTSYNLPIGDIQRIVARKILAEDSGMYSVANIHQSILQGDPALKLVSVASSDYAINADNGIKIFSESPDKTIASSSKLKVNLLIRNLGRFVKTEKVPVEITYIYKDSQTKSAQTLQGFAYSDTLILDVQNQKELQSIVVKIDPQNTLKELNKQNNTAELLVDWEIAKNESYYPLTSGKDIIAPLLDVTFNDRTIKNGEQISPKPQVTLTLQDDRVLTADTARISIFLKTCEDNSCEFERVNFSDKWKMDLKNISDRVIQLNLDPDLLAEDGNYEMLVISSDDAGNSIASPFTIQFLIGDNDENVKVIASPNPAVDYIRFETQLNSKQPAASIHWKVFNLAGKLMDEGERTAPLSGTNEWYWKPNYVSDGLYIYQVIFRYLNSEEDKTVTGKVVIIK
ncbi:C25 family cysteine peptidase [Dyadobacter sp. CY351]|uniref:putative type IX secretion system sortase PorU2 n=1 Tax=Dyadobacter sp. CY351 TaxID=2909337 RepID=UPI001F3AFAE0|nr:C25 family cysteine peptidase [Dyadobacter sp. CY351]